VQEVMPAKFMIQSRR